MRFILVDRIDSLEPGAHIQAVTRIRGDEDYLRDHFPGFPVVPGVLLTEMMGQAAAKCLDAERRPRGKAMLARILSANFRQWVTPGSEVLLHAAIVTNTEHYATAACRAEVAGRNAADAKLLFSFLARDKLDGDYRDDVLEQFLARPQS